MGDATRISAITPDWSREKALPGHWQPGCRMMRALRGYQAARTHNGFFSRVVSRFWMYSHRFWSVMAGTDISIHAKIGGGLAMPHPCGVVIDENATIGPHCLLLQQVTVAGDENGSPILLGHVDIGAGARILGNVTIGAHAKIGANAVVLTDVPEGATAVGIPARILLPKMEK